MQLGRTWTALIVVQVAIAVLPAAVYYAAESVRYSTLDPGYAADEFVSGSLTLDLEHHLDARPVAHWAMMDLLSPPAADPKTLDTHSGVA